MAYQLPRLINGKAVEWIDLIINLLGQPLTDVVAVNYNKTRNTKNVYGAGAEPVARVYGKKEYTASITLMMKAVSAIESIAPGGDITEIDEFDINLLYIDKALITRKHRLKKCRFISNGRDTGTESDDAITIELQLVVGGIDFDV